MEDRFKFRVFISDANLMFYCGTFLPPINEVGINAKLMQCTGLKDKNGKLIYEGDIVKITKESWDKEKYSLIYLICWDTTQWQLGLFKWQRPKAQNNRRCDRQFQLKHIVSFDDYTPNKNFAQCEILGNIHENPELLKEIKED